MTILKDLITVISCYKNLVAPLKILKLSLVSFPLHLVSCYIVFPLVYESPKGKNELDERPIIDIYRKIEEDGLYGD